MTEEKWQAAPPAEGNQPPASPASEQTEQTEQTEPTAPEKSKKTEKPRVGEIGPNGYRVRKRHFHDRNDGRYLRTIPAMTKFMPYIMRERSDALTTFADTFDLTRTDPYCRRKVREGKSNFTLLHVILAAYVRAISQKPGINRFVAGQRIYARNDIEVNMVVKREMTLESPDTVVTVTFHPGDTVDDVYEKFNRAVTENVRENEDNSFDKLNRALVFIPGLLIRFVVRLLSWADYHGWLPRKLTRLSPFHGTMFITSMGSLGIPPIYHHIYNFGNLPAFLAYGAKRSDIYLDSEGVAKRRRVVDFKAVTDERICDGFYYASAFKLIKKMVENPELLEQPPENIVEDID